MPRNIEIKAMLPERARVEQVVRGLADSGPILIAQDDSFFACANGRLKLREFNAQEGELIFYSRPDTAGPKQSSYSIAKTQEPAALREVLTRAYGVVGRVVKKRTLYLIGQTRVHLDEVQGLGGYLELEVVLADTESAQDGKAVALSLMQTLGVQAAQLEERAYVDLLRQQERACSSS